jgi:hypothetical protein
MGAGRTHADEAGRYFAATVTRREGRRWQLTLMP